MTPVAAKLDLTPRAPAPLEDSQLIAVQTGPEISAETPTEPTEQGPATPARLFLDRIGLIEKMAPLRELNQEIRLEHPALDNLFHVVESSPEILKRFLKFANGAWFNSRVQVDSP